MGFSSALTKQQLKVDNVKHIGKKMRDFAACFEQTLSNCQAQF